nr:phage integrase N-terminal domain-containing protein [Noviherbaspirillum saxi]
MRQLNWELKQLCLHHPDGSFATQQDRGWTFSMAADDLDEMGYQHLTLGGLKPEALAAHWQSEGLSTGTLKNRMAHLRWLAEKIGKQNIVARSNEAYGIADRVYVTNVSKARELTNDQLSRVADSHCAMSLQLQAAFGLRREESLKIQPGYADQGDVLLLKASWCKGGRPREIPIRTEEQRQLLDAAKALADGGSLIPPDQSYKAHLRQFRAQCEQAGIHKVHGHRHHFA